MAIRLEHPVAYKTMVKRAMVGALRDVFTTNYPEDQFQDLRITPEFPQSKPDYAAIQVRMLDSTLHNAGVGHVEEFADADGNLRRWKHRRFEGTIEFNIIALTPIDRDVLTDALIEGLSFGDMRHAQSGTNPPSLQDLLAKFFYVLYGDPAVPYSFVSALTQIALDTDDLSVGSESATIAQWQPEDVLIYTNTVDVDVHGGFYNSTPNDVLQLVGGANVYPYAFDEFYPLFPFDTTASDEWVTPTVYEDDGVVVGRYRFQGPVPSADNIDTGTVVGYAVAFADMQTATVDAGVVRGVAILGMVEVFTSGIPPVQYIDDGTVAGRASVSAVTQSNFVDSATPYGTAVVSAVEVYTAGAGPTGELGDPDALLGNFEPGAP